MNYLNSKIKNILASFLCIFLFSCQFIPENNNSFNKEVYEKILVSNELSIYETLKVDNSDITYKSSYFKQDSKLKGYSNIKNKNSYFYNTNLNAKNVEEYVLDDNYLIEINNKSYEYSCISSSILDFNGISSIINNSLNKKSNSGFINSSSILPLIRDNYYDLGYFVDYQGFIGSFDISYNFSVFDENTIVLEVDTLNIIKKLFPLINNSSRTYIISLGVDNSNINEYPINSSSSSNDMQDDTLKQYSSNYIRNVYSKLEYISNDLNFIYRCPKSGRLTYEYSSSNPNILDNNGNFTSPISDTSITISVSLKLDGIEFEIQEFTAIAHAPASRSGVLGSKQNPIYQGRKSIDKLEIYFIEMHKQYGDSIYIKAGDFDMLIDAGQIEDGYYVNKMLQENMVDSTLDLIVATHAHSDHIGGMASVLSSTKNVVYALDYGYDRADYSTSSQVRSQMKQKASKYVPVSEALNENNGIIWISDDFYITILDTNQYINPGIDIGNGDDNSASVTFILTYKNHSFYFSGDLDASGESYLINTNQLKQVTLMKATHHGTSNGNSNNLLKKLKPEVVAISTALVNRGNASQDAQNQTHPSQQALRNFYNNNAKVYCNFTMGTIHVTSYGVGTLNVEGLGLTSPYYFYGNPVTGEENKEFKDTIWYNRFR